MPSFPWREHPASDAAGPRNTKAALARGSRRPCPLQAASPGLPRHPTRLRLRVGEASPPALDALLLYHRFPVQSRVRFRENPRRRSHLGALAGRRFFGLDLPSRRLRCLASPSDRRRDFQQHLSVLRRDVRCWPKTASQLPRCRRR